jgi:hypothetical protein
LRVGYDDALSRECFSLFIPFSSVNLLTRSKAPLTRKFHHIIGKWGLLLAPLLWQVAHPICTWCTNREPLIGLPEALIGMRTEKIGFWPKARFPASGFHRHIKRFVPSRECFSSKFYQRVNFRRICSCDDSLPLSPLRSTISNELVSFTRYKKDIRLGNPALRRLFHLSPLTELFCSRCYLVSA